MKLKEKLAEEYISGANSTESRLMRLTYLAGFEKARELALQILHRGTMRGQAEQMIENLGEEEM